MQRQALFLLGCHWYVRMMIGIWGLMMGEWARIEPSTLYTYVSHPEWSLLPSIGECQKNPNYSKLETVGVPIHKFYNATDTCFVADMIQHDTSGDELCPRLSDVP
jgi:hypothetical protein